MNFKVGDRVIVSRESCDGYTSGQYWYKGRILVVTSISYEGGDFFLHEGDTNVYSGKCDKIVKDSKIARKLYPNHEVEGEWLILK